MKKMNVLALSLFLFLGACCPDCIEENTNDCSSKSCECKDFYVGDLCEKEYREQFYGTYTGTITGTGYNDIIGGIIGKGSTINQLIWDGEPLTLDADMDGSFTLTPFVSDGVLISGSGRFSGNNVSMNLTLSGNGSTVPVIVNMNK